jgi:hypothetical protein
MPLSNAIACAALLTGVWLTIVILSMRAIGMFEDLR